MACSGTARIKSERRLADAAALPADAVAEGRSRAEGAGRRRGRCWCSPARPSCWPMPFAYKAVIDRMSAARQSPFGVVAGAGARLCDGALRRGAGRQSAQRHVREGRAGCGAPARRHRSSATSTICRCASTSSGAPDALTKIVERGTKSIDMMLYFLLFNIAPTVIELAAICIIFCVKFGAGLVAATLVDGRRLHRLHAQGDRLARQAAARDERGRQPGDRPRRRLACSTTRRSNISAPRSARRRRYDEAIARLRQRRGQATRPRSPGSTSASR